MFQKQLVLYVKTINQLSNVIKKNPSCGIIAQALIGQLEKHLEVMNLVYDMVYLKEIKGEKVPNESKIYSIYEQHTDIIVKGSREVKFGHKVDLCSGKSNLVLHCQVLRGNPSDKELFTPAVDAIIDNAVMVRKEGKSWDTSPQAEKTYKYFHSAYSHVNEYQLGIARKCVNYVTYSLSYVIFSVIIWLTFVWSSLFQTLPARKVG